MFCTEQHLAPLQPAEYRRENSFYGSVRVEILTENKVTTHAPYHLRLFDPSIKVMLVPLIKAKQS